MTTDRNAPQPKAPEAEEEPRAPEAELEAPDAAEALVADAAPEPFPPPEKPEALEPTLEELEARAERADHYLELAQRTKAEFENYRKRALRDAAAAEARGVTKLAKELLPAVDNLERALEAAESNGGDETLVAGLKLVQAGVIAALARVGIEPFCPKGEPFDPQHHEAMAQQPVEGAEPGTIVEVYQRGYKLGDLVLRPARVVVAA
jgi:molecular chaperone GrpE